VLKLLLPLLLLLLLLKLQMRTARDALQQQLAASLLAVHRLQGEAAAAQSEAQAAKYAVNTICTSTNMCTHSAARQ
jgi:regulator of protease activity HflC (stomatin/prohibitin superfamily)